MTAGPGAGPESSRPRRLSPRWWFAVATVVGLLVIVLLPPVKQRLGVADNGVWFLDSYALLAACDALQAGLDPGQRNPLDVFGRPHSYSDWWFGLARIGLTREDNFLLGGMSVVLFLGALFLTVRPRTAGEAVTAVAFALSPPVLLGINRANNDLVVFFLLGVGLWCVRRPGVLRLAVLVAGIAAATGLKFYPVVAAGGLLALRPARRGWLWAAVAAVPALGVLWSVRDSLSRGIFPMPTGCYVLGAQIIWQKLGWDGGALVPRLGSLLILLLGGLVVVGRRWTGGLGRPDPEAGDQGDRVAFAIGAALLLGCFVAGISYAYRWIFALWLVPWLWRQAAGAVDGLPRRAARVGLGLLGACLWHDGLYCLTMNTVVGPMEASRLMRWEAHWSMAMQPLAWALMLLLTGWLLELALANRRGSVFPADLAPAGRGPTA